MLLILLLRQRPFGKVAVGGRESPWENKQTAAPYIIWLLTSIVLNLIGKTGSGLSRAYKGDSKETHAARGGFGDSVGDTDSSESGLNQCSHMTVAHPNLGCVLDSQATPHASKGPGRPLHSYRGWF